MKLRTQAAIGDRCDNCGEKAHHDIEMLGGQGGSRQMLRVFLCRPCLPEFWQVLADGKEILE